VSEWNDSDPGHDLPERRPYEPPKVAHVDLHADEVLVAGCKAPRTGSASGSTCFAAPCSKLDYS
jgi:hypothetical protein